jgi:hypothetical protein
MFIAGETLEFPEVNGGPADNASVGKKFRIATRRAREVGPRFV